MCVQLLTYFLLYVSNEKQSGKASNYSDMKEKLKVKISYSEKMDKSFRISKKKCEHGVMKLKKNLHPETQKEKEEETWIYGEE